MQQKITSYVWCTLQIEGLHNWPECPFEEVSYLRDPHRHIFHIKAYVPVTHTDRDVEFIMLKHKINKYLISQYWTGWNSDSSLNETRTGLCDFGSSSCEMIAQELIETFNLYACEVSEDGENGSYLVRGV